MDSDEPTTYRKSLLGLSDKALKWSHGAIIIALLAIGYQIVHPMSEGHTGWASWSDPMSWVVFVASLAVAFATLVAYGYLTEPFDHELASRKWVSRRISESFPILSDIPFEKANEIRSKGVKYHRQVLGETGEIDTAWEKTAYQVKLMLVGFGFDKVGEVAKVVKDIPFLHPAPKAAAKAAAETIDAKSFRWSGLPKALFWQR